MSKNALKESNADSMKKSANHRSSLKPADIMEITNKDPDRAYRWVSRNILDRTGGFDHRGWEALNAQTSKGEKMASQWGVHSSGTELRNGDLIACFMPQERADMRRASLREANDAAMNHIRRLRAQARSVGAVIDGNVQIQREGITETY